MEQMEYTLMKRKAEHMRCRCGQPVIVGLDADLAAFPARVESRRLTAAGEVAALTDGRITYEMKLGALDRRNRWTIPGRPAGERTPVHAEHRCGQPMPAAWLLPVAPRPPATITPEGIPF